MRPAHAVAPHSHSSPSGDSQEINSITDSLICTSRGAGAGEGAGEGAESPVPGSVEGVGVGCEGAPASGD